MSASLATPIHCEDTPSEFSWNPWFWMIFRTKTLISMLRLEDTGSKMSEMLGNPWKSMISGRFAWVWASKSTFSSWHFWHYRMCVFGFEYKKHKFILNLLFFHIILSKITNFLMSGILVRIMVGMLVRLLVGMYASNGTGRATPATSTILRQLYKIIRTC